VSKTEVAKALAAVHGHRLVPLQCYEGLDAAAAIYEWNYQRQLLAIRAHEGRGADPDAVERQIFSEADLLERPLLQAIRAEELVVLLIDEVDGRTSSSRPTCSSCWPISRSPLPSWARSRSARSRAWS
jgi:MoxR-like ATPase